MFTQGGADCPRPPRPLPRMPKAPSHRWSRAVLSGTARQPWECPWAQTLTARCIKTGLIGTSELSGMLATHSLVRTRPAEVRDFSTNLQVEAQGKGHPTRLRGTCGVAERGKAWTSALTWHHTKSTARRMLPTPCVFWQVMCQFLRLTMWTRKRRRDKVRLCSEALPLALSWN